MVIEPLFWAFKENKDIDYLRNAFGLAKEKQYMNRFGQLVNTHLLSTYDVPRIVRYSKKTISALK